MLTSTSPDIPGYAYGQADLAASPVTVDELAELKADVMFTDTDAAGLRRCGELLDGQVEQVLDVWYGFVASQPHLLAHFANPAGQPIPEYLDRVRARFGQWIRDTCTRPYDRQWLAYQHEIAHRHTEHGKNRTDEVSSTAAVPLRHLIGLIVPIATTVRPFLAAAAAADDDVDALAGAWLKAVVLQVALWAYPFARDKQW